MIIILFAADSPQVIQLTLMQGLCAIGVILVGIGIAWGSLKTSVKHIGSSVRKIEQNIERMSDSMLSHTADITGLKVHTKYGITNSPTVPSEEGSRLLAESGFDAQYSSLKDKLFKIMDNRNIRTLYDYEIGAFEALQELRDDPLIDPLKDYAVNHPPEPLELIFRIASWVIRDDYAAYKGTPTKHGNK
jgi:hypothetical protein